MPELDIGVDAPVDDVRATVAAAMRGELEQGSGVSETPPELSELDDAGKAPRDESGRFAKKDAAKPDLEAAEAPAQAKPANGEKAPVLTAKPAAEAPAAAVEAAPAIAAEAVKPDAVAVRAPPGWSVAAKVAFANADPAIVEAVAKREKEISDGFAQKEQELGEFKSVKRFADMARQGNTTLERALESYVGIEQLVRRDVFAGIEAVLKNANVDPVAFAQAYLARRGAAPSNAQQGEAQQEVRQQAPAIDPQAIVSQVEARISARMAEQNAVREFEEFSKRPDVRFLDNVRPQMAKLLDAGLAKNFQEAYDAACWNNAEIRSLLIKEQSAGVASPVPVQAAKQAAAATQARQAAKSITGSPSGSPEQVNGSPSSVRDVVIAAMAEARSRV